MSMLIVDDDPDVRKVLSRFLSERGFDVRTAGNGQEALARIGEDPPEVIVSDIRMAGINGIELLQAVRARFPGIPCILMTGHGDSSAVHAVQHGAFDYLKKPIKLTKLLECIRRAWGRRELEDKLLAESRSLLWPKSVGERAERTGGSAAESSHLVDAAAADLVQLEQLWGILRTRLGEAELSVGGQEDRQVQGLLAAARQKLERLGELAEGATECRPNGEPVTPVRDGQS